MTSAARLASFALALALLPFAGCYQEVVVDPPLDAVTHCEEREFWECRREVEAGRLGDRGLQQCLASIDCGGAAWPPDCEPVESDHERCIARLRDPATFDRTSVELLAEFDDCRFCGG